MKSFPWDSLALYQDEKTGLWVGDRQGTAQDTRDINKIFFSNGVILANEDAFQVTPGEGMNVIVAPGNCSIEGTIGIEVNERGMSLQASSSEDRIDTIVLRWNANIEARKIDLYVKTGVAQSVPVRPQLTRSESVWELGIADIFVAKNSGAISAARITDTRLQTDRCGMMTPLLDVDTTTFFNQIQAAVNEKVAEIDALADFTYLQGGFYALSAEDDGNLYVYYDSEDDPPPLSLDGGNLYYTVGDNRLLLGSTGATPAGTIMAYAGNEIPDGWLNCNGQEVSREEYASLFAAIGEDYGAGDGEDTFNVPNLTGRFVLGESTVRGHASVGGEESVTLTINTMPNHSHAFAPPIYLMKYGANESASHSTYWSKERTTGSVSAANTGGGQAHNNMPPYIAMKYIISTGR